MTNQPQPRARPHRPRRGAGIAAVRVGHRGNTPTVLPVPPAWHRHAACANSTVDPDVFFGHDLADPTPDQLAQARQLCRRCPVRQQCADSAATGGERFGVWAGQHPDELPARTTDPLERAVARLAHRGLHGSAIARRLGIDTATVRLVRERLTRRRRHRGRYSDDPTPQTGHNNRSAACSWRLEAPSPHHGRQPAGQVEHGQEGAA